MTGVSGKAQGFEILRRTVAVTSVNRRRKVLELGNFAILPLAASSGEAHMD